GIVVPAAKSLLGERRSACSNSTWSQQSRAGFFGKVEPRVQTSVRMLVTKLKIGMLVGGHVVVGLFLAVAAHGRSMPDPLLVLMLALAFADAGLLGIWGALGSSQPRWRIPILLATSATLGFVTA